MARQTTGHMLFADISGYTNYLAASELEHAEEVLSSLMVLLIDRTLPPMRVAGLRGDAVFSYGLANSGLGGQALVEMIEDTYVAFRRALEQMVINTTCTCNACANIAALDLKFFVHHGSFSISELRGTDELVGSSVIEIFRLLKNGITDATGIQAYTAFTDEAVEALELDGFTTDLTRHIETFSDVDPLTVWVQDMHQVWERERDSARLRIDPEDVLLRVEDLIPLPVPVVWGLLLQPTYRSIIYGVDRQDPELREAGRIAEGSVFTCYHGKNTMTTQTVLALQPMERIVTHDTTPIPGASILAEAAIEPRDGSTLITLTCSRARGPWLSRAINNAIGPRLIAARLRGGLEHLRAVVEQELADGRLVIPEPNDGVLSQVETAIAASLPGEASE
jgi:hypothetical protein